MIKVNYSLGMLKEIFKGCGFESLESLANVSSSLSFQNISNENLKYCFQIGLYRT